MNSLIALLAGDPQHTKVSKLEEVLKSILQADAVAFYYRDGRDVRSDAKAQYVLDQEVELRAIFTPTRQGVQHETEAPRGSSEPPTAAADAASTGTSALPAPLSPEVDRFIRDLDALERRSPNSFVWIKFLIQERIPQLGIPASEANAFLNRLLQEGVVMTRKVPNPNRPEFPSTSVMLNRDHPAVKRLLVQNEPRRFQPIRISGPLISEDIIRDRRARG